MSPCTPQQGRNSHLWLAPHNPEMELAGRGDLVSEWRSPLAGAAARSSFPVRYAASGPCGYYDLTIDCVVVIRW